MATDWRNQPIPARIHSRKVAYLLCTHCGGPVLKLMGFGAGEFARTITGRLICEYCDRKRTRGEALAGPREDCDGNS